MQVLQENYLEPRDLFGFKVQVEETIWTDGGRSYHVHVVMDEHGELGDCLTEDDAFDADPTDEQLYDVIADALDEEDPDSFPQTDCGCGYRIILTPNGWQHDVAPWFWGDNHEAHPAVKCTTCGWPTGVGGVCNGEHKAGAEPPQDENGDKEQ